jgi:hypothetical protein
MYPTQFETHATFNPISLSGRLFCENVFSECVALCTDYMKVRPVCHHPNEISENSEGFDVSVTMYD